MKITNFRELDKDAVAIAFATTKIKPFYQKKKKDEEKEVLACAEAGKLYGVSGGYLAFFSGNVMKVVPTLKFFADLLEEEGYQKVKNINVPFSIEFGTIEARRQWTDLVRFSESKAEEEALEKCLRLSEELELAQFEDELKQCMEIPKAGLVVRVQKNYLNDTYKTYKPLKPFQKDGLPLVGKYNVENGVCIFVYRNGKTYLTKSEAVKEKIASGGYVQKETMDVPLSHGEQIMTPALNYMWNNL